ncbi:MAG: gliding motility-associated C-terminal domain-containing protein [Bacteroidales bacterium]|nr:gliding motility-associated C-terminal domain-containing protein [Candidatus Colimorpha onthohippi]
MKKLSILFLISLLTSAMLEAQVRDTVPNNVPRQGLVAYYGFSGNAYDYSGNANHGQLCGTNVPTLTTDRYGNANSAYKFGGIDNRNWIKVNNSNSLQFNNQMSISFWVQMCSFRGILHRDGDLLDTVTANSRFNIIAKGGDGHPGQDDDNCEDGFVLSVYPKNYDTIPFKYTNSSGDYKTNPNANLASEYHCYDFCQWVHVVITVDQRRYAFYINGTLYGSMDMSAETDFSAANAHDLYIGRMNDRYNRYPFNGCIDDIAIYNIALSDDAVDSLFNNYHEPNSADNDIYVDSVVTINPCGNNMGTITIYPHPGQTYTYAMHSPNDQQTINSYSANPGSYRIYVVTQCGLWDTNVTLVCDCSSDPELVSHEAVCPGTGGQRGDIETVYSTDFNSLNGWTANCSGNSFAYWTTGNNEPNYREVMDPYSWTGYCTQPGYYGYSGKSAWCPSYFGYNENHSCSLMLNQGITIDNDPAKMSISFMYMAVSIYDDYTGRAGYNTLKLQYATSTGGPWNNLWSSGGGDVDPWRSANITLSNLTQGVTYYFRFLSTGDGYVSSIDNFAIKSDTRWYIPDQVTGAAPGSTISTNEIVSNTGTCPVTHTTYWHIIQTVGTATGTDADTVACDSAFWWGAWRYESMTYTSQHKTNVRTSQNKQCDSTVDHHLTVYHSDRIAVIDTTVCDRYVWPIDGNEYTESALKFHSGINQYGCESNDSLYLTVHYSFESTLYDSIREENLPYLYQRTGDLFDSELRNHLFHYTSQYGCDSNYYLTLHIILKLFEPNKYISFPNIVTANGDGVNDIFTVIGINKTNYPENTLAIYNRWGVRVFHAKNIDESFEGWNPQDVPTGTYYFHFAGKGANSDIERNGVIEVIR